MTDFFPDKFYKTLIHPCVSSVSRHIQEISKILLINYFYKKFLRKRFRGFNAWGTIKKCDQTHKRFFF
jgi:hypothetical protein